MMRSTSIYTNKEKYSCKRLKEHTGKMVVKAEQTKVVHRFDNKMDNY